MSEEDQKISDYELRKVLAGMTPPNLQSGGNNPICWRCNEAILHRGLHANFHNSCLDQIARDVVSGSLFDDDSDE